MGVGRLGVNRLPFTVGPFAASIPREDPFLKSSKNDFTISRRGQNYIRLSNKTNNRQGQLAYLVRDKRFTTRSGFGQMKLQPVGARFKLLIKINGKFWAMTAEEYGGPKLANPSNRDNFQLWDIEPLPDGYHRISNVGLKAKNSPYHNLFLDKNKDELFFAKWDAPKSLNGRWHFAPGQAVSYAADRFDNRGFYLRSGATNQYMCLNSSMTSDATFDSYIGVCDQQANCRMTPIKTINGDYIIKLERTDSRDNEPYYLSGGKLYITIAMLIPWHQTIFPLGESMT